MLNSNGEFNTSNINEVLEKIEKDKKRLKAKIEDVRALIIG